MFYLSTTHASWCASFRRVAGKWADQIVAQSTTPEPARPESFVPLLEYQREDVESEARFRWNCWSRQTGKSFTKSLRRILRGLERRRTQIFLSAGERQSRELMAKARQHCEALKIATDYYDSRFFKDLSTKHLEIVLPGEGPVPLIMTGVLSIVHTLELRPVSYKSKPTGGRIIGLPANPQTARGLSGDVLLDEFAMHAFDDEIWGEPLSVRLPDTCCTQTWQANKIRLDVRVDISHDYAMSAWLANLPRITAPLRYAEHWVGRTGGLLVSFIAGAVGVIAAFAFELHWSLELAAFPGLFVVFFSLWWVLREVYWRTGRGRKIGIAYDGHGVPMDDWVRTREEFARLVEERKLDRHISLRLLPALMIATQEREQKIYKKYGFSMVLTVTCCKQAGPATDSSLAKFEVRLTLTTLTMQKQFLCQLAEIHGALMRPPDRNDVLGVLKHRATTVFEPLLLWLGVTDLVEHDYAGASRFFQMLDNQLQNKFRTDQKPRVTIRRLDVLALTAPSRFPPSALPEPGDLEAATTAARECVRRYGDQFPAVRLLFARDLFYNNELDEALAQTEKTLRFHLEDDPKRVALLHRAVLNLLLDRPESSADSFDELRETETLAFFDWHDLIQFADYCVALGYHNAVFLQALYRRFAGPTVTNECCEDQAFKWLQEDASRNRLCQVLERAGPVTPKRTGTAPSTRKGKREKPKRAANRMRRRKTRNKRRRR